MGTAAPVAQQRLHRKRPRLQWMLSLLRLGSEWPSFHLAHQPPLPAEMASRAVRLRSRVVVLALLRVPVPVALVLLMRVLLGEVLWVPSHPGRWVERGAARMTLKT